MAVDGFGFPIPDEKNLLPGAADAEAAYRAHPPAFLAARESEMVIRGLGGVAALVVALQRDGAPLAYFSGGGSGSGKTAIARVFIRRQTSPDDDALVIDPDEFKGVLPEYQQMRDLGHPGAANVVHKESKKLSLAALELVLGKRRTFFYDSTLASAAANRDLLARVKTAGFRIVLVAATVSPPTALRRVLRRGEETGRYVPPSAVLATHKRFSESFREYEKIFDSYYLFDNNGPPGSVRRILTGGRGQEPKIDNEAALDDFYRYEGLNENASSFDEIGV